MSPNSSTSFLSFWRLGHRCTCQPPRLSCRFCVHLLSWSCCHNPDSMYSSKVWRLSSPYLDDGKNHPECLTLLLASWLLLIQPPPLAPPASTADYLLTYYLILFHLYLQGNRKRNNLWNLPRKIIHIDMVVTCLLKSRWHYLICSLMNYICCTQMLKILST
jgi:hypothetical protein